eukprot:SAG11_NODE_3189_length_2623_cov_2.487718_1_plen_58_part_00
MHTKFSTKFSRSLQLVPVVETIDQEVYDRMLLTKQYVEKPLVPDEGSMSTMTRHEGL